MALFGNSKCDCGHNKSTCDLSCLNNLVGETELKQTKRISNQRASSLERAHETISDLKLKIKAQEKKIWQLEQADHCCPKCGNVEKPSNYADGC